jgi:ADP-heptose:LPS heptosyltransferase
LTAPMTKADMGATDEKVKAFMNKTLKRIFAELPEVRRVHVMDKNRADVGVFQPS